MNIDRPVVPHPFWAEKRACLSVSTLRGTGVPFPLKCNEGGEGSRTGKKTRAITWVVFKTYSVSLFSISVPGTGCHSVHAMINPQIKLDVLVSRRCAIRTISGMIGLGSNNPLLPRIVNKSPSSIPFEILAPLAIFKTRMPIKTHKNPLKIWNR